MRIRFIKNYNYILSGSTPDIQKDIAEQLIRAGYAVEISESDKIGNPKSYKNIEQPQKDKMVRKTKRK